VGVLAGTIVDVGKSELGGFFSHPEMPSNTCTLYGSAFATCPQQVNPELLLPFPQRKLDLQRREDRDLIQDIIRGSQPEFRSALGELGAAIPRVPSLPPVRNWNPAVPPLGELSQPPPASPANPFRLSESSPPTVASPPSNTPSNPFRLSEPFPPSTSPPPSGPPSHPFPLSEPSPPPSALLTPHWDDGDEGYRDFTLVNRTGLVIGKLFVRKSGNSDWVLTDPFAMLSSEDERGIHFPQSFGPCQFDIKIEFLFLCQAATAFSSSCQQYVENVNLCKLNRLTFYSNESQGYSVRWE
jgi:hypothetical protein